MDGVLEAGARLGWQRHELKMQQTMPIVRVIARSHCSHQSVLRLLRNVK